MKKKPVAMLNLSWDANQWCNIWNLKIKIKLKIKKSEIKINIPKKLQIIEGRGGEGREFELFISFSPFSMFMHLNWHSEILLLLITCYSTSNRYSPTNVVHVLIFKRTCGQRYSVFYNFGYLSGYSFEFLEYIHFRDFKYHSMYLSQLMTIIGFRVVEVECD